MNHVMSGNDYCIGFLFALPGDVHAIDVNFRILHYTMKWVWKHVKNVAQSAKPLER